MERSQALLWGNPFAPGGAHSSTLVNLIDPLLAGAKAVFAWPRLF